MERITDIGTLLSCFQENEEETMVTRFHGIDRHKKYSTVSGNRSRGARDAVSEIMSDGGISL
jgi:hypothetical protein